MKSLDKDAFDVQSAVCDLSKQWPKIAYECFETSIVERMFRLLILIREMRTGAGHLFGALSVSQCSPLYPLNPALSVICHKW